MLQEKSPEMGVDRSCTHSMSNGWVSLLQSASKVPCRTAGGIGLHNGPV